MYSLFLPLIYFQTPCSYQIMVLSSPSLILENHWKNSKIWKFAWKAICYIYAWLSAHDKIKLVIGSRYMWNLNQKSHLNRQKLFKFPDLFLIRTFKVAERSLAVCEYMEFAKSWKEKSCSSQDETWQVKNILMEDFDWQEKCDVVFVSVATWTIEYNLKISLSFS